MSERPGSDHAVVIRAVLIDEDRYGNQIRDWDHPTETPIDGIWIQAISGRGGAGTGAVEYDVDREFAGSHVRMFAPYDTPIEANDRVLWRGRTYEVDGDPQYWEDDNNRPHHLEAGLKRVTG